MRLVLLFLISMSSFGIGWVLSKAHTRRELEQAIHAFDDCNPPDSCFLDDDEEDVPHGRP